MAMSVNLDTLWSQVEAQKERIPSLYGKVDFSITPERFTDNPAVESMLPGKLARQYRQRILADSARIERARAYTLLGDTVADAYAALTPTYGFRPLVQMLQKACDQGVESIPDAPQELKDFIAAMERTPTWLDMNLVEKGARYGRIQMANLVPFAIRGAFIATFMNKYSGLPMALTGALSTQASVQRVNETASFFTTATLPGALRRDGVGFKAAAMVRLMHSMVRFHLMKDPEKWDCKVYGIPIPQVDQMPAGTIPAFLTAFTVISKGRTTFNDRERAVVELCRYQCYLLGLPEDLLPATPREIVDVMLTYASTLRDGYDDATCGELVRATMAAYRPKDHSLKSRIYNACEKSFATVFFQKAFLSENEKPVAKMMGVEASWWDYLLFVLVQCYVIPRLIVHRIAMNIPLVNDLADRFLINKINRLLVDYGHPEFTTNPDQYRTRTKPEKSRNTRSTKNNRHNTNGRAGAAT
ncbi:MAG: oxygenase MpaB family protein [Ketobacteraceae bacterium]|nr:oxygenase MpaB family protein [Ketobacteraceae bacterium]